MKKGRHRRYEEARNLKRGPELDIEALFTDLEAESPTSTLGADDVETDPDEYADPYADYDDEDDDRRDD